MYLRKYSVSKIDLETQKVLRTTAKMAWNVQHFLKLFKLDVDAQYIFG